MNHDKQGATMLNKYPFIWLKGSLWLTHDEQLAHSLPVKKGWIRIETSSMYGLTSLRNRGRTR